MKQPHVCAILVTCDRPQMSERAVRCFDRQSYPGDLRHLLIFDSGDPSWYQTRGNNHSHYIAFGDSRASIGELRNKANALVERGGINSEILIHFDSDDISHPKRIAEQVALLQASGKPCVAYNELLFWREQEGEAWLYHRGSRTETSLCYWRETWEKTPFPEVNPAPGTMQRGEGLPCNWRVQSCDVPGWIWDDSWLWDRVIPVLGEPPPKQINRKRAEAAIIATIHAQNARHYHAGDMAASPNWRRASEWDDYVRRTVEAA